MIRNLVLASAAFALAATPVAAQQIRAEIQRQSAPVKGQNDLGGENTLFFIIGIAVVAASIFLLSENDDPVSA